MTAIPRKHLCYLLLILSTLLAGCESWNAENGGMSPNSSASDPLSPTYPGGINNPDNPANPNSPLNPDNPENPNSLMNPMNPASPLNNNGL